MAAAWITLATELLVESLALRVVLRRIEMRVRLARFARIAAAVTGMGLLVWLLHSHGARLVWLIACAAGAYPLLLLATRAVTRSELTALLRREAVG